jgi:Domain of unknown function (DUF222)/HNH endonuclease
MFDVTDHLDGLRCRETTWLLAHRDRLVGEQRRLRVEELAVTLVLDESLAGRDGVSARTVRETVETARALESLPCVAAAAYDGELSSEQLAPVAALADETTDAEWASRAPHVAPVDLARMVRTSRKPTVEESRARRDARSLRMWWKPESGMLQVRGELPDIDGARIEATIDHMTDRMRPAKGQPWDTRDHRGADALMQLCDSYGQADEDDRGVSLAPRPLFVVEVPEDGPAEIAGIPLPDAMVEQLRAVAAIEPVLVDGDGVRVASGTRRSVLSPKIVRAVLLRDGHCRWPGCERRTGLQVHHRAPRSWGGGDDIANLAAVCTGGGTDHHTKLVPHGPWALIGNPNRPDGLHLVPANEIDRPPQATRDPLARAGPSP